MTARAVVCAVTLALALGCDGPPDLIEAPADAGAFEPDGGGEPDPCCACAVEMGAPATLSDFACVAWLQEADPAGSCLALFCDAAE